MNTHFWKIFNDFTFAFLVIAMLFLATIGILATCNQKEQVYESDEYRMWIGGDGDTIWE